MIDPHPPRAVVAMPRHLLRRLGLLALVVASIWGAVFLRATDTGITLGLP